MYQRHDQHVHTYHTPVLTEDMVAYLNPQPHKLYVDATLGGGGHTRAILDAEPQARVLAIDWDLEALQHNAPQLEVTYPGRFECVHGNFGHLQRLLQRCGYRQVDGICADLGTSHHQIQHEAGFSFSHDTQLDMRMSPGHYQTTAADIVNKASYKELADIFYVYGQERFARRIARAITEQREQEPIRTTRQLAELVRRVVPGNPKKTIHPATRVFQALRIVVNHELENLHSFLKQAPRVIRSGGRCVCISFHSLEDRAVKDAFRDDSSWRVLTKKIVTPSLQEITENPSARSAKLRAAERI